MFREEVITNQNVHLKIAAISLVLVEHYLIAVRMQFD